MILSGQSLSLSKVDAPPFLVEEKKASGVASWSERKMWIDSLLAIQVRIEELTEAGRRPARDVVEKACERYQAPLTDMMRLGLRQLADSKLLE